MAKRLTKALRGKRRWFGINVDGQFSTRNQLTNHLNMLSSKWELTTPLRLMDFNVSSDGELWTANRRLCSITARTDRQVSNMTRLA